MAAFGVHFGTCSACLAVYKDGQTDVVANDLGDRVTPCVVSFTDHDMSVGAAAKQGIIRNACNTITHVKQVLGVPFTHPEVQHYKETHPVKVLGEQDKPVFEVTYKEKKSKFSPNQVAVAIYQKMLETAQSHGGSGIKDAVLTVPHHYTPAQRSAISEAAGKAGFNVLRIVTEPVAAALAYDLGQGDCSQDFKALVFRLGGSSSDVTVLHIQNGLYRVVSSITEKFGGDGFTEVLLDFLSQEFQRKFKCDMRENKRSVMKLRLAAEACKQSLSTLENTQVALDSLFDGMDYHTSVSRARYDLLCSNLLPRYSQLIEQALDQASLKKEDISKVVVCGGGVRAPVVQKLVSDCLPFSDILSSINGDEVIATGAAKEAAILVAKEASELDLNLQQTELKCLSRDVCVKAGDGQLVPILPRHSLVPWRRHQSFQLSAEQTSFCLDLFETDNPSAGLEAATHLAQMVMHNLPAASTVDATFHLKREGALHITCKEPTSNSEEDITIEMS